MSRLILFVGLPGSGKTTYWEEHRTFDDVEIIRLSLDDFRKEICGKDYFLPFESVVHMWVNLTGRYLLSQGYSVLIDATHLNKGLRQKWTRLAQEYKVTTVCIYFDVSLEVCLKRNEERERQVPLDAMTRMHAEFEEPELEEFDQYIIVDEDGDDKQIK